MNTEYLTRANEVITDKKALIVVASRRAEQLANGARPLVRVSTIDFTDFIDVALLEIAEGKIKPVAASKTAANQLLEEAENLKTKNSEK